MGDLVSAIEDLYRLRYTAFRDGVLPLTGTLDGARDAVQEGFAQALRDRSQFRDEGSLEGWVWRIVFHAALRLRTNGQETALELDDAIVDDPLFVGESDPRLATALRSLPPRRRLIVFLRYFADLSYAQIGDLCAISEGTVAAALAQAHAELSGALTAEGVDR
jgi:RNA polymerase sigma-70 factor (ECF subfamily)